MAFEYRKVFWLREEIPIADDLLSYAPKLLEDFLNYHTDFIDGDFVKGPNYVHTESDISSIIGKVDQTAEDKNVYSWKIDHLKYTFNEANIHEKRWQQEEFKKRYPTAVELTEKYSAVCPISVYSVLEKNSIIYRHTGIENRDNEYLRIHIPLLIPPGDIYFECENEEIDWSDIWGFDNQCSHSAYNPTFNRRLVYLIDIKRSFLGIPDGPKFDRQRELDTPPFIRGERPKLLHACQRKIVG